MCSPSTQAQPQSPNPLGYQHVSLGKRPFPWGCGLSVWVGRSGVLDAARSAGSAALNVGEIRVTVNAKVATPNAILAQFSAAPLRSSPSLASEGARSQSNVHLEGNVCSTKL